MHGPQVRRRVGYKNEVGSPQHKVGHLGALQHRDVDGIGCNGLLSQRVEQLAHIRGDAIAAEWGTQVRNYVLAPYKMVKDTRTSHETSKVQDVLDGELEGFIDAYLRWAAT